MAHEMKNCYFDRDTRSIADLCDYYGKGLIITRINVPVEHRGKGIGRKLLSQIVTDADDTRTTLYLEILASGDMDHDALEEWYGRMGFRDIGGMYRRRPVQLHA
jgi:GNAT superfamily N-acetyltransferase